MFLAMLCLAFVLADSGNGQSLAELRKAKITGITEDDIGSPEPHIELSLDQIIVKAMGGIQAAAQSMVGPGGMILAELDMLLTEEQFSSLYEPPEYGDLREMPFFEQRRKKRKAVRQLDLRWTDGIVPYYFANGHFSDKERYLIKVAMREWEKYSCVRFREKTNSDKNYVRFQNGMGCNSQLGMVGGMQVLNLDVNGCRWKGLYLHEIGHALGLVHEHQLPNRDEYIEIMYDNVEPSMRIWFNKYSGQEVNQYDVDYEYSSVMHYGITAFSSDGKSQTIKAKDKSKEESIGKVWRKELSFTDVKSINRLYRCAERCPSNIRCRDGGFVDQNCKCICPDGSQNCQEGQASSTNNDEDSDETCVNKYDEWACNVWATQGECKVNPKFMLESCRKACKKCGNDDETNRDDHVTTWAWQWLGIFANLFPKSWTVAECTDKFDTEKCQKWESLGDCVTSEEWMKENCRKTCNMCDNKKSTNDSTTNCRNIYSNSEKCDTWAKQGECGINPYWMTENCRKSCRLCHKLNDRDKPQRDDATIDKKDEEKVEETDRSGRRERSCHDLHDTKQCKRWADQDECSINPDWMVPNCRKSCDRCVGGVCRNIHDDTQCDNWANRAECIKNPSWMRRNCAKSCRSCNEMDMDVFDEDKDKDNKEPDDEEEDDRSTVRTTQRSRDRDRTTVGREDDSDDNDNGCTNERTECEVWARNEHCDINPGYMLNSCKRACGVCSDTREDTGRTTTATTTLSGRDNRRTTAGNNGLCMDDNVDCESWKNDGACESNPGYALRHCRKSCKNCKDSCRDEHTLCAVWGRGNNCNSNPGYMLRFCQKTCKVCQ